MMMPPVVLRLRMVENGRKKFGLWIPVFLLWPLLLLLAVLSLPLFILLLVVSIWSGPIRRVVRVVVALCEAVLALRGLTVDVEDGEDKILIKVI